MIGRGVRSALARQDWVAVAIEFVLVVVGVLLAFKISDWADAAHEREARAQATRRLLNEAQQDVAALRDLDKAMTDNIARMERSAAAIRDPSAQPAGFDEGVAVSRVLPKPDSPDTIYHELIASGLFGRLGDVAMRDAVADYVRSYGYLDQAIDYVRATSGGDWPGDTVHYRYDPSSPRRIAIEVDRARLAANLDAQDLFLRRLSGKLFVRDNLKETLAAARRMCAEVARIAARPCQVPAGPVG